MTIIFFIPTLIIVYFIDAETQVSAKLPLLRHLINIAT